MDDPRQAPLDTTEEIRKDGLRTNSRVPRHRPHRFDLPAIRNQQHMFNSSWQYFSGALALFLAAMPGMSRAASPQNVLVIIADDFGTDSCSLFNNTGGGASLPPTPTLETLAASGVKFTRAYATPLCSPTRACMLTGRHSFRTGVGEAVTVAANNSLPASEFTLPEAFAAHPELGCQLAQFGKWHLTIGSNTLMTPSTVGGWPYFSGELGGVLNSYTSWTKVVTNGTPAGTSSITSTAYHTTEVVNDAVAFINAQTLAGRPWFAWVAFAAPHTPFHKPPSALCPHYASLPGTQAHINANQRLYYEAAVEAMDAEINRLLGAVDRTRTNIVFLGDNGTPAQVLQPPVPAGHGKDTLYEGGLRVPFIVSGPAVTGPGRSSDAFIHVVDLFSTILEMAGISPSSTVPSGTTLDSRSFLTLLSDPSAAPSRTEVYSEMFDATQPAAGGRALRDSRWKIIRFRDGHDEFYDLAADPWESANILTGTPSAEQLAAYYQLRLGLSRYSATTAPAILSSSAAGGRFAVSLPVVSGAAQGLWRSSSTESGWAPVASATSSVNGSVLTLTDPSPPASRAFYRVLVEIP
jgi:arylsulfatase A-like enzyme